MGFQSRHRAHSKGNLLLYKTQKYKKKLRHSYFAISGWLKKQGEKQSISRFAAKVMKTKLIGELIRSWRKIPRRMEPTPLKTDQNSEKNGNPFNGKTSHSFMLKRF